MTFYPQSTMREYPEDTPLTKHDCATFRLLSIGALDRIIDAKIKQKGGDNPHQIIRIDPVIRNEFRYRISDQICESVSNSFYIRPLRVQLKSCKTRIPKTMLFLEWAEENKLLQPNFAVVDFKNLIHTCENVFKNDLNASSLNLKQKAKTEASLKALIRTLYFAQTSESYRYQQPKLPRQYSKLKKWVCIYKKWIIGEIEFIVDWEKAEKNKEETNEGYIVKTLIGYHQSIPTNLYNCLKYILKKVKPLPLQPSNKFYEIKCDSGANSYERALSRMVIQTHWEIINALNQFAIDKISKKIIFNYWNWNDEIPDQSTVDSRLSYIHRQSKQI